MTKIFSIWFVFEDNTYMGLVTMSVKNGDNATFFVSINDVVLFDLLPEGKVVFNTIAGLLVPTELKDEPTCNLVLSIAEAIYGHLSTHKIKKD